MDLLHSLTNYQKPTSSKILNPEMENSIPNPLLSLNETPISPEFVKLSENLELYYAPVKIVNFNDMTRTQLKEYLMSIYGDENFCDIFAGVIKKDYNGLQGGCKVMTPKEARNWFKKNEKKLKSKKKIST